jgi:AcrR family transcriptional regulator
MDAIARAAGLTKRSLYYHFDSKDDLTAAVLDHQHRLAFEHIGDWDDGTAETCADFLSTMFKQLEDWAQSPRWLGSGFTRLTMELAELPGHPARQSAHRHKAALEDWLASKLEKFGVENAGYMARQVVLLIEGAMTLTLIHGDTAYITAAAEAAQLLAKTP